MTLPDFFITGVPKAGTSALHGALATHPQLLMSHVKEPKFFLCDGVPPTAQRGPGDAHSLKEWIWRREEYEALFDGPPELVRGESTPFYLYDRAAHRRISNLVPAAKLIVVVRDPVDRAHSNWLHLCSDGLETVRDFMTACSLEEERVAAGWGPFWHYLRLGRYGEQLRDLFVVFPPRQVHVLRYRQLVDAPVETLDDICRFLGVETGRIPSLPPENTRGFVRDSVRSRWLGKAIRAGATAGAKPPPKVWRKASTPLLWALQRGAGARPAIAPGDRRSLVERFADDIRLLQDLTGMDFSDWLSEQGRGEFRSRVDVSRMRQKAG
jgi:hypothetical protein